MALDKIIDDDDAAKALGQLLVKSASSETTDKTDTPEKSDATDGKDTILLQQWLKDNPEMQDSINDLSSFDELKARFTEYYGIEESVEADYALLLSRIDLRPRAKRRMLWYLPRIAAAVVLCAVGVYYFAVVRHATGNKMPVIALANDLTPGGYHALLTLSNGTQVVLDSIKKGATIARQGSTVVENTQTGELAYNAGAASRSEVYYNTLTTRRGDTYKVILPDGSSVWLNSASSLHFPTQFAGKTREVTLDGEGYFEISPDRAHPFIVHTAKQEVEVLGTRFDIMSYEDENEVKTTLLQGAVKVSIGSNASVLNPGQQLNLDRIGSIRVNKQANIEEATAWTNNYFECNNTDLRVVMRQLSRWYNATIEYDGKIPSIGYTFYISRNLPVSNVLKLLEQTNDLKFLVSGNKIIVKK